MHAPNEKIVCDLGGERYYSTKTLEIHEAPLFRQSLSFGSCLLLLRLTDLSCLLSFNSHTICMVFLKHKQVLFNTYCECTKNCLGTVCFDADVEVNP